MARVVTERCVNCRYTDCCAVCPVDCFYEIKDPAMLVIDPQTCIDCDMCVPECPIYAIYPDNEVPDPYQEWIQKNADLFSNGEQVSEKTESLPGALSLEAIQAREKANGWNIAEPSVIAGAGESTEEAASATTAVEEAPPPPAAETTRTDEDSGPARRAERFEPRPSLKVRPGGRIRIGYRIGTVQEIRKSRTDTFVDMQILFDNEDKPVWHPYSSLQTLKDRGEVEILDPGPVPGIFQLLFKHVEY